jgi:hypothetical protein
MFHEELANSLNLKGKMIGGDSSLKILCLSFTLFLYSLKYLECRNVELVFLINKEKQTSSSITVCAFSNTKQNEV